MGWPRRAGGATLSLLLAACSPAAPHWLPDPEAASVLLFEVPLEGVPRVTLHHLQAGVAERLPIDRLTGTLYALSFSAPIGLPAGTLTIDDGGGPVPEPRRTFSLDAQAGPSADWVPLTAPPPAISGLRLKELSPCIRYEQRVYRIPNTIDETVAMFTALDADRALMATDSGRFFLVGLEGATPLTGISTATPHLAGVLDDQGELWLLGAHGKVAHGSLEAGFVPGPDRILKGAVALEVDRSHRGAPFEIFTVTPTVGVEHFDGTRWTLLRAPTGLEERASARVAWVAPRTAVVTGSALDVLLELSPEAPPRMIQKTFPPRPASDAFSSVVYVDDVGGLAATRYSVLFRRESTGWEQLPDAPTTNVAMLMLPLPRGVLYGGRGGELFQWFDGFGYCPGLTRAPVPNDTREALLLHGTALFAAHGDPGDGISIVLSAPIGQ
ncbi:MAG: hypothetical protein U1E65_02725 [Myxococcota bacterium]